MKYIMLETEEGQKLPFIFPDFMNHDLMAKVCAYAVKHQTGGRVCAPMSAGFVGFDKVEVSGHSESLKLEHNPLDTARIMLGSSIAFMPDSILPALITKMLAEKSK